MAITIAVPKETKTGELRAAMTPTLVSRLTKLGANVKIQHNVGAGIHAQDATYKGTETIPTAAALYHSGDVVLKVQPPTEDEVASMK
jgi:NAD(P) transhydrogenase subunit alpha